MMSETYNGERFLPEKCEGEMAIEHYQRYLFAKKFVSGKVVLDAACGEGYGSSLLAEQAESVAGLDIDKTAVNNANEKYANEKISFHAGSVGKLPFEDDSFDVVVSFETIEHVSEELQTEFLKEIRRVLKKEGSVIISTPNKAVYTDKVKGVNKFHIKEFYSREFIDFMKGQFKYIDIYCQYPEMGYYVTAENEKISAAKNGMTKEDTRYVILVCSNIKSDEQVHLDDLTFYDTSMYYFLNEYSHKLEQTILKLKEKAERFQSQQENSIIEQKKYIDHLERDLSLTKKQIEVQAEQLSEQKKYIDHLERDLSLTKKQMGVQAEQLSEQKEYIDHLEKDLSLTKEQMGDQIKQLYYDIAHRDRDIENLNHEIEKRDKQIEEISVDYNAKSGHIKK